MAKDDWYRRTTWTAEDQEDFNTRLRRSRKTSRSQYLLIQAGCLLGTEFKDAAIELVDRMLSEYPERIGLGRAWLLKAQGHRHQGRVDAAIDCFRKSLQAEREFSNVRTGAWLEFGWFAAEKQLTDQYEEVLKIFDEFRGENEPDFPISQYKFFSVLAVISEHFGDLSTAARHARLALQAAERTHSGYRYHPDLGLVTSQPNEMRSKLEALAGTTGSSEP